MGLTEAGVLDFSVNVNPYGPAPAMREAIRSARVEVYPDSTARTARLALAAACDVGADNIVLGPGGADLLWTLARILIRPGRVALMVEPTFSEFRAAVTAAHGRVVEWRASAESAFALDPGEIARRVRAANATAVYLCTPNNPTGSTLAASEIIALARELPDVTLVLDQSFLSLSEGHADAAAEMPTNVVRVRSLTKEHAIPGVRVGYVLASSTIAAAIEAARPAWSTGTAAQAAAIAACQLTAFVGDSRTRLLADRRALVTSLVEIGLDPFPSTTTFCVVPVGDARRLRHALLSDHGLLIRDCASFGLPKCIRLAARPAADRARLLTALSKELPRC